MAEREVVKVALEGRAYEIIIARGLLRQAGALIAPHLSRRRAFIVTDQKVGALYAAALQKALAESGVESSVFHLAAGEDNKSLRSVERLCGELLTAGAERRDCLIALGGGIVGDMTGFAAAILRRGMEFIQIPTTLLAQVDSSVGGKTGVNTPQGKNLIGAFYQPRLVLIDMDMIASLDSRQRQAGYAEIVKYGLLGDADFFEWLEQCGRSVLAGEAHALAHAVATSCRMKARIVAEDEREGGKRALLNLGHTFGHALEAEAGYDGRLLHGEAVALGCVLAAALAARLGLADASQAARIAHHFEGVGMIARLRDLARLKGVALGSDALIAHMYQDKKVHNGKLVLIAGPIGDARILTDVDEADVRAILTQELASGAAVRHV